MLVRWTFNMEKDQHLGVEVRDPEEDKRIKEAVDSFVDLLYIPGTGNDAYINLHRCNAMIRQEIDESQIPKPQAIQNAEAPIPMGSQDNPTGSA